MGAATVHNLFNLERHPISRASLPRCGRAAVEKRDRRLVSTALHRAKSDSSRFPANAAGSVLLTLREVGDQPVKIVFSAARCSMMKSKKAATRGECLTSG